MCRDQKHTTNESIVMTGHTLQSLKLRPIEISSELRRRINGRRKVEVRTSNTGPQTTVADISLLWVTSLRCSWQTRTTRCLTHTVLYTDVINWWPTTVTSLSRRIVTVAFLRRVQIFLLTYLLTYYTHRPPKLTAPETIDETTLPAAVPEIWLMPTKI